MKRVLVLLSMTVAVLWAAAPAFADTNTETFRYPVEVKGYQVRQEMTIADHPKVDGFITAMSVDVVDANGTPVPIQRLMLHHIVFSTLGQQNPQCSQFHGFDYSQKIPGLARPFYGAGEERNKLALPPGYGLPMKANDTWLNTWMLMNHRKTTDRAFIEWKVTYTTDPSTKPVDPFWLDVKNCNADPIFNVPGGGKPGSTYRKSYQFNMPESGHIVAAGGHVHGGADNLQISQPTCGDRKIMQFNPAWGMPSHPFYHVRPILHEPGPIAVSGYLTSQGFPVAQGQPIKLTATYDNSLPHTRVMGISLIYVAPSSTAVDGCGPPPSDVQQYTTPLPHRTSPPHFVVPIVGIAPNGKAHDISAPPGKRVRLTSGATIGERNFFFSKPNVLVKPGTKINWSINNGGDPTSLHNVTLASGPRGFASPNHSTGRFSYRFRVKGKYRIFCALHPVSMTETVVVR